MNTIEETIKLAGFGRKKALKKQIEVFEKDLLEGEDLLGVATSFPNPTEQLYITNQRIIAHKILGIFENKRTEIPITSFSSSNIVLKGLGASIEIVASNNSAKVEKMHVHIAYEIKKLIDSLTVSSGSEIAPQVTTDDTLDQIKKLAELRDSGILTEDEFNAKKKKILGI